MIKLPFKYAKDDINSAFIHRYVLIFTSRWKEGAKTENVYCPSCSKTASEKLKTKFVVKTV
jgi:hypothetical protein